MVHLSQNGTIGFDPQPIGFPLAPPRQGGGDVVTGALSGKESKPETYKADNARARAQCTTCLHTALPPSLFVGRVLRPVQDSVGLKLENITKLSNKETLEGDPAWELLWFVRKMSFLWYLQGSMAIGLAFYGSIRLWFHSLASFSVFFGRRSHLLGHLRGCALAAATLHRAPGRGGAEARAPDRTRNGHNGRAVRMFCACFWGVALESVCVSFKLFVCVSVQCSVFFVSAFHRCSLFPR